MTKNPSYGITETIGGIFMPRQYTHLKGIESEAFQLKEDGRTTRGITQNYYM